jgi:hypothetical protein
MIPFLDILLIDTYLVYPEPLDLLVVAAVTSKLVQTRSECFKKVVKILPHEKGPVVDNRFVNRGGWTPCVGK